MLRNLFSVLVAFICLNAVAETNTTPAEEEAYELGYYPQPYWFIQAHGGASTTFTNGENITKLVTPSFGLSVGRMFAPAVGARIKVNGYEQKGSLKSIDQTYKYKYINSTFDVMLNVTNLFRKTYNHPFNAYLIGGVGLDYAWDNDELIALRNNRKATESTCNAWGTCTNRSSLFCHTAHAGILLDYGISKNWSVGLEGDINNLGDRFNSKYNNSDDWMLTAQVTVTYKFGHKKAERPAPEPEPEPEPTPEPPKPAPAPQPAPEPEPEVDTVVVDMTEPLREVISFLKRESSNTSIKGAVVTVKQWTDKYPEKKITVDAYADRGTGNPRLNKMYSDRRAKTVVDQLKKSGISGDRIVVVSHGDTVQPFPDNDSNRCVIIVGQE